MANITVEEDEGGGCSSRELTEDDVKQLKEHIDELEGSVDKLTLQVSPQPKLNPLEIEHRLSSLETKMNILIGVVAGAVPIITVTLQYFLG